MKNLIIVGAGGFGREILKYAQDIQAISKDWKILGFLDDNLNALNGYNYNMSIIASIQSYIPQEGDCFVMGIQSPQGKLTLAKRLKQRGAQFVSLIHPTVEIGYNVTLGSGCVMCPHSVISCDVKVGDFVTFNAYAAAGHDAIIGDWSTISPFGVISGHGKLGKGAYVGVSGCVLPGVIVGDFATVGAGSVVVKNVKPETTVIGVPARNL
jgi:sugar O-acyltransferase (sialic acid O-acetyltransferase NeuD family)